MDLLVTLHKQVEQAVQKNMTDRIAEAHGYYLLDAKVIRIVDCGPGKEKTENERLLMTQSFGYATNASRGRFSSHI